MNFIEKLLLFFRFDTILVIIDQLTKQAIFISVYDIITSVDLICLFVLDMFSKHSISSYITFDHGLEFVSNFSYSLDIALDMCLHFTSGYYPEGDKQTECMNQALEQYLHIYCNYQQVNWSELLSLIEFSYSNASSTTTSVSSFFTNKGYHFSISVHSKCNITSFQTHNYTINLDKLQSILKAEIYGIIALLKVY